MNRLVVVAIDFGTTYSGWAFSYRHEYERDPLKISAQTFKGNTLSHKVPTCILIKSDGKTVDSFGYNAENKYAEICEEKEQRLWFFFKRFKMMLFKDKGMTRHDTIEDETGKKLPAIKVFKLSIDCLVKDVLDTLNNHVDSRIYVSDIHWVLTVPAIWNDAAKQFMREAAEKARIPGKNLSICLEPEAASVYCRHLPVSKEVASLGQFSSGTKYLVLDAGGGTVDITVHEVTDQGNLKELHKASGGDWGGTKVDEAYEAFLTSIVGPSIISTFKTKHLEDYIELCRNFEKDKRQISPTKRDGKVTMRVIPSLSKLCKDLAGLDFTELFLQSKFSSNSKVVGDKLRINAEVFAEFFKPTVSKIISHIADLLTKPAVQGCAAILMVGGFSESPMLQENVKSSFRNMNVIVPDDAGLAVLKGAVIFGHEPTTIIERICKYTYGYATSHRYNDRCNHPKGRVEKDRNGDLRCYDIFAIHVKAGQSVKVDEEQPESIGTLVTDDQTSFVVNVYASSSTNPRLTTEDGCSLIGKLTVPISDTSSGRKHEFGIRFIFGGTEIFVKVVDKESGEIMLKSVDFLG
ncbi:heat shock 70 kDa protein 12B-like [Ruditapes philippinarum]|uniref:heat shock 70 kDa protein 12B-like n=1 Tax=Ruditapes philippinarum TaxID=129788 RepID=UPI00295B457C|nr:heat shock 70 kDa protein 12B-like [Ruditapes philippinarum]